MRSSYTGSRLIDGGDVIVIIIRKHVWNRRFRHHRRSSSSRSTSRSSICRCLIVIGRIITVRRLQGLARRSQLQRPSFPHQRFPPSFLLRTSSSSVLFRGLGAGSALRPPLTALASCFCHEFVVAFRTMRGLFVKVVKAGAAFGTIAFNAKFWFAHGSGRRSNEDW